MSHLHPTVSPSLGRSSSLEELSRVSQVNLPDLHELIEYGVLKADESGGLADLYPSKYVTVLQRAKALRKDLALDAHAFALAFMLSERIVDLEGELAKARAEAEAGAEVRLPPDAFSRYSPEVKNIAF